MESLIFFFKTSCYVFLLQNSSFNQCFNAIKCVIFQCLDSWNLCNHFFAECHSSGWSCYSLHGKGTFETSPSSAIALINTVLNCLTQCEMASFQNLYNLLILNMDYHCFFLFDNRSNKYCIEICLCEKRCCLSFAFIKYNYKNRKLSLLCFSIYLFSVCVYFLIKITDVLPHRDFCTHHWYYVHSAWLQVVVVMIWAFVDQIFSEGYDNLSPHQWKIDNNQ